MTHRQRRKHCAALPRRTTWSRSGATFPILHQTCTASRWSTSTTRPRRRSRGSVIDAHLALLRRRRTPTSIAACTASASAPPPRTKTRADKVKRVHQRRHPSARSSSRAARPRAINLVAQTLRPEEHRGGRRDRHLRASSITRTSCPGRCSARRAARCCASCRSTTPARFCSTSTRQLLNARTKLVAVGHVSNALGTINPIAADDRARARAGAFRARRRRAGRAAHGRRRAGARLRLLRLLRPQDLRPDRHRRALRQERVCSKRCRPGRAAAT